MQKITDFIVEKRYYILVLFIILTIVSFIISRNVVINHDISSYLPDDSETKIGNQIMEDEFAKAETSDLLIMVKDMDKDIQDKAFKYLQDIEGVSEVTTEEKDEYTLFTLVVSDIETSKLAKEIYDNVTSYFKGYDIETSGSVSDQNKDILPVWIVALAVFCALIILIIMCESYTEPFLFLITILMAVVLNKGTNIIFKDVSYITSSIAAILQMALSMDYSIMLMNRYEQERTNEKDKVKAMKKALNNAFKSISSSSITTIVGLLALIFMSFKIGADLGFVLAKGVFFSLVSIFFCLPALILLFDKLIRKTKKKSPKFNLKFLGNYSYHMRYIGIFVFIAVFLGSFILKNHLTIDYTDTKTNPIDNEFITENEMAIIYPTMNEEVMSKYCKKLDAKIDKVLCYSNTINEELTYNEFKDKLTSLNVSVDIDDELLKILYYNKFNKNDIKMSLSNLITFTNNNILNNKLFKDMIPKGFYSDLDTLNYFAKSTEINKKRSKNDLAIILELKSSDIDKLMIYYNSLNPSAKLTLTELINFVNTDVLTNSTYAKNISDDLKSNLITISKYLNKELIKESYTYENMTNVLDIDSNSLAKLYTYYLLNTSIDTKLSLKELIDFIDSDILTNKEYQDLINISTLNNLNLIKTFTNKDIITKSMSSRELSSLLNVPENLINVVMLNLNKNTLTPYELVNGILNSNIKSMPDENSLNSLNQLNFIMISTLNNQKFTYEEISNYLGINVDTIKCIYSLYESKTLALKPLELINFILENQTNEELNLSKEEITNLNLLKVVMESVINDTKYSCNELSKILNIDNINLIYSLYEIEKENKDIKLSLNEFVTFLNNKVLTSTEYGSLISQDKEAKITTLSKIISNTLKNKTYSEKELYDLLKVFNNDINSNIISLGYLYYGSVNDYKDEWTFTIIDFVDYLDSILKDNKFKSIITEDLNKDIKSAKDKVNEAKDLLVSDKYSRIVIQSKMTKEGSDTFKLIKDIKNDLKDTNHYLIGSSPMAYELSETFGSELTLITILTMLFIFIVVVFTFKSLIIPIILVLVIQCAVYLTMGILALSGGSVYFISLLIVQSILMGATIDYAIVFTSYYLEARKKADKKTSLTMAYNNSIHTILTSASILTIVTLVVGYFASAIAGKICITLSEGTIVSSFLILLLLPELISLFDRFIVKDKK